MHRSVARLSHATFMKYRSGPTGVRTMKDTTPTNTLLVLQDDHLRFATLPVHDTLFGYRSRFWECLDEGAKKIMCLKSHLTIDQ